jgi:putative oligomerization/nucleic acid binding protein
MLTFLGSLVVLLILVILLRLLRAAETGAFTSKVAPEDRVLDFPGRVRALRASAGAAARPDAATRLKQLQEMKDSALITDEEFEAKRAQILDAL